MPTGGRVAPVMRHSFGRAAGVTLHWAQIGGESRAPTVVMLHGLQDCHLTWRRVGEELGRDRRVLLPDLPGHGLSGRPDVRYDLPWYARVIRSWMDDLALAEIDLVGHSLGGGIAQMLLLECPSRIRRVVLAASGGLGREIMTLLRLASIPRVVEDLGQPFFGAGTRLALGRVLAGEDLAALVAMNGRSGSARAFARTVRDLIDWRGQRRTFFQRADELGPLPPIAVIWGDRDRVIPAKHARALTEILDGVEVKVLPRCGHYLHQEAPGAFAEAVRVFLDDPSARPASLRRREPAQQ